MSRTKNFKFKVCPIPEVNQPVDTRIFSKKKILWRGRHKLLGSGAEVLMRFQAVDSVKADLVLGFVALSEHCYCVAVCDAYYFAGDGLGVGGCGCEEDGDYYEYEGSFEHIKPSVVGKCCKIGHPRSAFACPLLKKGVFLWLGRACSTTG